MLNTRTGDGFYEHDVDGNLVPTREFQQAIDRAYRRVRAFDALPSDVDDDDARERWFNESRAAAESERGKCEQLDAEYRRLHGQIAKVPSRRPSPAQDRRSRAVDAAARTMTDLERLEMQSLAAIGELR